MSSPTDTGYIALIKTNSNNNPPISCTVSHAVSKTIIRSSSSMSVQNIIKIVCFLGLSLLSVIGGIIACLTSHVISPYMPQPPDGPVNGQWSDWSGWSICSILCSSNEQPFGNMTRLRYCNAPPPQQGGAFCDGNSTETTQCFRKLCPMRINGGWAPWSPWSTCSTSCQQNGTIPKQTRSSTCTNPSPKDGGKNCDGDSIQKRLCTWLPQCPVNGQWGEWYVAGACESVNRKSCALGKKLYQRQCNKPSPSPTGKDCLGLKEKNEDCWFDIGCPVGLQPPLALQVFGNGSGVFEVQWQSVPYGVPATGYRIYLTIDDKNKTQLETIHMNISAVPTKDVAGRRYSVTSNMKRFLESGQFSTLTVRMSSIDFWGTESFLSTPVQSRVSDVDGQWGEWDHWSECSTQCINHRGSRFRKRKCDNPAPTSEGKPCSGKSEEEASCIGMATEC